MTVEIWVFVLCVILVITAWIVGEARDVRALRITGFVLLLPLVPAGFFLGEVLGQIAENGRQYGQRAADVARFAMAADQRLDAGDAFEVHREIASLARSARSLLEDHGSFEGKGTASAMNMAFEEATNRLEGE